MEGGVRISRKGYRQRLCHGHPRADSSGYVMEHILVFEEHTGISVPTNCCIHHLNGDKKDNRIENLCLMSIGAHTTFHHTGSRRSEETREKLSKRAKKRFSDKRNHPFFKEINLPEMVEMRNSGATVLEVCKHFGISKRTYYDKMEDYKNGFK